MRPNWQQEEICYVIEIKIKSHDIIPIVKENL